MTRHTENTANDCIFCRHEQSASGKGAYCRYFGQRIVNPRIALLRPGENARRFQSHCAGFALDEGLKDKWEGLFGRAAPPPPTKGRRPAYPLMERPALTPHASPPFAPPPPPPAPAAPQQAPALYTQPPALYARSPALYARSPALYARSPALYAQAGGLFSFKGKINRLRYLATLLGAIGGGVVGVLLTALLSGAAPGLFILAPIAFFGVLWVMLAAAAKRFRSMGASPWWAATLFLPYLSLIATLFLLFAPPQPEPDITEVFE